MCNCVVRFSIAVSVREKKSGDVGRVEICGRDIRGLSVCALRRDHIVDKVRAGRKCGKVGGQENVHCV